MTEKSILISVNPPYAEWLVYGVKTIEWRTKPLPTAKCLQNDIKAYVYETKKCGGSGAVIGEVKIFGEVKVLGIYSREQLKKYKKVGILYGAKMVAPKKYKEPRALSDFKRANRTEENSPCAHTKWLYEPCETCKECNLKRPPQSWCYVEEIK